MRAIRWHGRGDVRLDEVPAPGDPGPGEVLLEVVLCGVCGTDFEEVRHGPLNVPVEPHPLTGASAPLTLGHEVLGRVLSVGAGVTGLSVGDRVVPDGLEFCGECESCRAGLRVLCTRLASIGLHRDGGMAEYLKVPAGMCVVIPEGVPDLAAVLVEPLAVSVRAVRRAALRPEDRILVIGAGAIGQCIAVLAAREGARVTVVDHKERRLEVVRSLVPDARTIQGEESDEDADCVFECAGTAHAFETAVRAAAPGGRVVVVGAPPSARFSPLEATLKELTIITSLSHDLELDTRVAAELLASLDLSPIVTRVVPIDAVVETVFGEAAPAEVRIKTVVDPRRH